MENSPSENNKRIAKNTLFLYFRSILTLGVGLYTSREVLAQLGVEDFGIYNVVGSIIVLFSFIQGAMSSATSRFFTFDLGKGDFEQLKRTFSLSMIIHGCTALIIFVLGETVGLWFLNTQLVIPEERMGAANFIYQFTIFATCIGILQIPYHVAINAHERMKVYAYAGIADAVFKLGVALALGFAPIDKLKFYSVLLFGVFIVMAVFYWFYCHRNFKETHFKWFWDKKMFLERMVFGGYEMLGVISVILAVQGGTFLINRFYGILLNAANGVSTQVMNATMQFTTNFFAAVTPRITKLFATGEMERFYSLIIRSSKFCFLLSFMFMAPLALQIDFILSVWLKIVPDYAGIFCQLAIINTLTWIAFWPVAHGIISTGKNKTYRKIDGLMLTLAFPLTYLGLHFSPIGYMCSHIFVNFFRVAYIALTLRKLTGFSIRQLISQSLLKCLIIGIISISLPIYITLNMSGWQGFFVCSTVFFAAFAPSTWFIGLNENEREKIIEFIKKILYKLLMPSSICLHNISDKTLIFPKETFYMPQIKDALGKEHKFFKEYSIGMPDFYLYKIPNAYCFGNREEIWTEKKELIIDHTTQKENPMKNRIIGFRKVNKIHGTVLNLSLNGLENNYYHWLTECLGRLAIVQKANINIDFYIVENKLPFQREYLSILGIEDQKIIPASEHLFMAENLITTTLINNYEIVQYDKGYNAYRKMWLPRFMNNMYINLSKSENEPTLNIYITRANARCRKLINEQEILKILEKYDYKTVDLDKISVKEQINIFSKAKKIIGLHGAGLANLFFASKKAKVLEIFPNGYYDSSFKLQSLILGLNYSYIIGESTSNSLNPQERDILLNESEFQKIIEIF